MPNRPNFALQRLRARDETNPRQRHRRHESIHTDAPGRTPKRAAAQRLDEAGDRSDVRPLKFLKELVRRIRQPKSQRRADAAIPNPKQNLAEPFALALRRDHHVHAPRRVDLLAVDRKTHRHRRVLTDDGRTFARQPNQGRARWRVRVATILPIPPQLVGKRGVGAEDTPVQRFCRGPVFRAKSIDFSHGRHLALRLDFENAMVNRMIQ